MHKKSRKTPSPFVQFVQDKMCVCVRTRTRTHGGEKSNRCSEKNFSKKSKKFFKKLLTMFFVGVKMSTSQANDLTVLASKTEYRISYTEQLFAQVGTEFGKHDRVTQSTRLKQYWQRKGRKQKNKKRKVRKEKCIRTFKKSTMKIQTRKS